MLEDVDFTYESWGSITHLRALAHAMRCTSGLRAEHGIEAGIEGRVADGILSEQTLNHWRNTAMPHELFSRGTTHLSVTDEHGNIAGLTSSNGEGCSYVLPGTGIMLNNMLGEEDLNPNGFHRWPVNTRLASMMCPTLAKRFDGSLVALGTGGSNRIRSAVLQVLVNLFGFGMSLQRSVESPRLHLERTHLSLETGFPERSVDALCGEWTDHKLWEEQNMFFGGVHAVARMPDGSFRAAGDPRRGGAVAVNEG
jgi:gamma-glutamyltranspeptidase/glutathione hydrolase